MIDRILVPLDGSAIAEQALPHAEAMARALGAGLVLARVPEQVLVPVMSAGVWLTESVESEDAHENAESYLAELASRPELEGLDVQTRMPDYPVVHGLIEAVEETGADLVVMTSHGLTGPDRWVFGSVAEKMIEAAPVPLYVVRAAAEGEPVPPPQLDHLLVPLDGSETAEAALEAAAALALARNAKITLCRVPVVPGYLTVVPETSGWIPEQVEKSAAEATAYLAERAEALEARGLEVETWVEYMFMGSVADGILEAAKERDCGLVVMSSHGRSGISRWFFGSVASRVLRGADRPVWVVRIGTRPAGS